MSKCNLVLHRMNCNISLSVDEKDKHSQLILVHMQANTHTHTHTSAKKCSQRCKNGNVVQWTTREYENIVEQIRQWTVNGGAIEIVGFRANMIW